MATTTTETRHTPEDLLKIQDRPMPELVDGQLVERSPMGQESDAIASRLGRLIGNFVDEGDLGLVNGPQGSYQCFPDDPLKVRIPDVSFTRKERIPAGGPARGHSRVRPDLVVEVVSPHDSASDVLVKVREFLDAGVPLVWLVNPDSRDVAVFRGDGTGGLRKVGEALDGEAVLPGFRLEVGRIFQGL